ncbi:MAG: helix-turn-helix transcriptional regulator [Flavobacteriaceae bacterium]|nr:helix-turn-helix transcriptional regulator [Flavobacteriaceae bacterium]
MKSRFFVLFLLIQTLFHGQEYTTSYLSSLSYESLIELYDDNVTDTLLARKIAATYIKKAREATDSVKMARGYSRLAFVAPYKEALKYLDTTIAYSKGGDHPNFPTIGYLFKSLYLYNNEAYEESLANAILGYQQAKDKQNVAHQITALHQINGINELWGDYQKTLDAARLTYELLQSNRNIDRYYDNYIASVEGIGKCFVRLKKPDSALAYFKKGIDKALQVQDSTTYHAFVSHTGTALYMKGAYQAALDSLNKADQYRDYFIHSYPIIYNYYLGSIYHDQGKEQTALFYFKKADSIYEADQILSPELPLVYNRLTEYYKLNKNEEMQLKYLYKLVLVDSLIDAKQVFVKAKTEKEYTIPELLEDKNNLITGLQLQNKKSILKIWVALIVLMVAVIALIYYFRRQKVYKKRFENLMEKNGDLVETEEVENVPTVQKSEIAEETVAEIMGYLKEFETNKGFLSQKVSLNDTAKHFGTNSTYLSKVVNMKKKKNFSKYINDLRIGFAFDELKVNKTFRKYTIKAIAHECGFKSAESFSKAFYKKFGIYPSFYIKRLLEEESKKGS